MLARVSVLFFLLPFFGARNVPALWKAGISLLLAVLLTPLVPSPPPFPATALGTAVGLASEILLGFSIALGVRIILGSVQLAGQFMGFQMGFNMASAMDPETGGQSVVISQALHLFTVLVFFSVNGHHLFIRALSESFDRVPPGSFFLTPGLVNALVALSNEMFVIALKLAAPIIIALFLSNLCLGIVARTVPQVNILMVGFPLNICLGLIFLGIVIANLGPFLTDLVGDMARSVLGLLRLMQVPNG